MKHMRAVIAVLAIAASTMVLAGCHASASVNPNDTSSVSLPR